MVSSKIMRLDRQFHDAGFDIVGVQESRIASNIDTKLEYFQVIGSAATPHGVLGVQLWFSLDLKCTVIEVIPASPRLLFPSLKFVMFV